MKRLSKASLSPPCILHADDALYAAVAAVVAAAEAVDLAAAVGVVRELLRNPGHLWEMPEGDPNAAEDFPPAFCAR